MPGDSDVRISVPTGWEQVTDPVPGVALLMAARRRPATGILPSMAVAAVPLAPDRDRSTYLAGLRTELTDGLDGAEVEDEDAFELDGGPVDYLRLSHRDGDRHLVSEVWLWLADGRAWSVSGTVDRRDYADWCDVFEEVAATFDPEGSHPAA
jgi:hypothetical protein